MAKEKKNRPRPVKDKALPFSNGQYRKHYTMNAVTAARKVARRQAKGKKSGRRTWMKGWPSLKTQKGGKNAGAAPRYDPRPVK